MPSSLVLPSRAAVRTRRAAGVSAARAAVAAPPSAQIGAAGAWGGRWAQHSRPGFSGKLSVHRCRASGGGEGDAEVDFDKLAQEMQKSMQEELQRTQDAFAAAVEGLSGDVGENKKEITYDPMSKMKEYEGDLADDKRKSALTLFSPSKINLFLRVVRRREDGFHDLASLFHVIDLGDTIKFSVSPSKKKDAITTNDPDVPLDESNLIIKALNKFREKTGSDQYYWIHLDKRVPSGAGLGGGSGNASTALFAANQMCGEPATEAELLEWSGEVGSDCPVFFSTGAAYCTGRGEIVENVDPPLPLSTPMLLVKPSYGCSTPQIFKALDLDSRSTTDPLELLEKIKEGASEAVCVNDLEAPAFSVVPELRALKQRLQAAGRGRYDAVFMSGSGSTIVCMGGDDAPNFLYDEDGYEDVFISTTRLLTRKPGEWYQVSDGYMGAAAEEFAAQRGIPQE